MKKNMKLALLVAMAKWAFTADAQETSLVPGRTKVRVTTGADVRIDGFAITRGRMRGRAVSEDERSVTLLLQGQPVTLPRPESEFVGTLESIDHAKLTLAAENGTGSVVIPRDAIAKLETRVGRSGSGVQGATVGGVVMFALVGLGCTNTGCDQDSAALHVAVGAGVGAPNVPVGAGGQARRMRGLAVALRL